jgi:16S rRNA (guanine1516-N2)-methyltransferase
MSTVIPRGNAAETFSGAAAYFSCLFEIGVKLIFQSEDHRHVVRWADRFELLQLPGYEAAQDEFYLRFRRDTLFLCHAGDHTGVCVRTADVKKRLRGDFALARACGVKPRQPRVVLDATAGLGIDGLALQALGQDLILVERHVALWALLDNYLQRAAMQRATSSRIQLIHGDAFSVLGARIAVAAETTRMWRNENYRAEEGSVPGRIDVVYIDPMFPPGRKTALPNKRMQYLRLLLETDSTDAAGLLALGRRVATERVVLKRRRLDPVIDQPDWQIPGKTVRYDVYRSHVGERNSTKPRGRLIR